MSSKNQSIKSFFTSSQNKKTSETKQEETEPVKKEDVIEIVEAKATPTKDPVKKSEETKKTAKSDRKHEKENNDSKATTKIKSPKKKEVIEDTESPKLVMTKTDSSDSEDSPIKRKASMSSEKNKKDAKRRKLVVQSSSSEDEEKSVQKKKTSPPKAKKNEKKTEETVANEKKNDVKKESAVVEKKNDVKKEQVKVEKKADVKKEPVVVEKKEEEKVKKEDTADKKEQTSPPKSEKTSPAKPTKPRVDFFSKSTSNFAGGQKVGSTCSNQSSSGSSTSTAPSDEYLPSKETEKYHPVNDAVWLKDQPVPYRALAQTLYCMEKTTKRLELLSIVSNYFRSVILLSPKDLVSSIYILTNKVAPDYDSLELGIGDTVLFKALGEATGCTVAKLKTEFQNKGDIGLVAEANRCTQKLIVKPKKLTVNAVFTKFKEIASISGNASQTKKCDLIKGLLVSCDAIEARYLMRSLAGKLRNGLGEQSILQALGHACTITPPILNPQDESVTDSFKKMRSKDPEEMKAKLEEAVQCVKHAYYQSPNYERVVSAILAHGVDKLKDHCRLSPGVPLKPMLAYPTKGLHEVLKRFDNIEFTCEYKYDGERAQIHILEDGSINIYSRNSENNTSKYPDIINFLKEILMLKTSKDAVEAKEESSSNVKKVTSAIIDAEVVAYDTETKVIKPFQVLSTRKRKDVNESEIKIQVCIFAFDLLYLNGEPLIEASFRKRRELLYEHFPPVESKLMHAVNMNSSNLESIQEFLDNSIKDGCEGLMVKTLDVEAHYEISKRSHNWLKLKKDYLDGVGDTLDLVVIGGYLGTGKRTGVYGGYLLAVYNPDDEEYQTICKLGTGLKDDDLQKQFESLSKIKIDKPKSYYRVNDALEQPDHWFEAEQVWEIKCADFSISPVHTAAAGMVDSSKGISMRFPRFIRLRDDKKAEDATSAEQLAEMYKSQQQMINQNQNQAKATKSDNEEDEDIY